MKAAAKKALLGTPEDVQAFLDKGQYEARKKDEADAAAAKDKGKGKKEEGKKDEGKKGDGTEKPKPDASKEADQGAGAATTGKGGTPMTAAAKNHPAPASTGASLASTGAGSALPWAAGGTAVALAGGAGILVATRRRRAAE